MTEPKKKLGISWSAVNDYTYYGQLGADRPYVMCWVFNAGPVATNASSQILAQITYKVSYKQKV